MNQSLSGFWWIYPGWTVPRINASLLLRILSTWFAFRMLLTVSKNLVPNLLRIYLVFAERSSEGDVSHRGDIYSVGAIMAQMFTHKFVDEEGFLDTMMASVADDELVEVIMSCCGPKERRPKATKLVRRSQKHYYPHLWIKLMQWVYSHSEKVNREVTGSLLPLRAF